MEGPTLFFVSYAAADEAWAEWIAWELENAGYQCVLQKWDFGPGSNFVQQMQRALRDSSLMIAVLSNAYLASAFCQAEWAAAFSRDPAGVKRQVLPVRVEDCPREGLFDVIVSIDIFDKQPHTARETLLKAAKGARGKPSQPPAFPGDSSVGRGGPAFPGGASESVSRQEQKASDRVFDAAIPSRVVMDEATELEALVRLPGSPGLKGLLLYDGDEEADLRPENVRSRPFKMAFAAGRDGRLEALKARVVLTSPGFEPPEQTKGLLVPPDGDSEPLSFLLTPRRVGKLKVLIELHWEDAVRAPRSLVTECVADSISLPPIGQRHVVQMQLEVATAAMPQRDLPGQENTPDAVVREQLPTQVATAVPRGGKQPRNGILLVAIIGAIAVVSASVWRLVEAPAIITGPEPTERVRLPELVVAHYRGSVRDAQTRAVVVGARVSVELMGDHEARFVAFTDEAGRFSIDLGELAKSARMKVRVEAADFTAVDKEVGIETDIAQDDFRLSPVPKPIEPPRAGEKCGETEPRCARGLGCSNEGVCRREGASCVTRKQGECRGGRFLQRGGILACVSNNQPRNEVCDGQDNDCDGTVDEEVASQRCGGSGPGVCGKGKTLCEKGEERCVVPTPRSEVCGNSEDEDCDGLVDEGCITVVMARIGCLDIQRDGNLTAAVAGACNGRTSCAYKAPTETEYRRMGVNAATRTFCTQAMEIIYQCGQGGGSVTVPGDAWNHPPAQLSCPGG